MHVLPMLLFSNAISNLLKGGVSFSLFLPVPKHAIALSTVLGAKEPIYGYDHQM